MITMSTTGTLKELTIVGWIRVIMMFVSKEFSYCYHCSRKYLLELMIFKKNHGAYLCLWCHNQDARLKVQGSGLIAQRRKAQELMSQDSRDGQSISCEKKAQGSRFKP